MPLLKFAGCVISQIELAVSELFSVKFSMESNLIGPTQIFRSNGWEAAHRSFHRVVLPAWKLCSFCCFEFHATFRSFSTRHQICNDKIDNEESFDDYRVELGLRSTFVSAFPSSRMTRCDSILERVESKWK